MLPYRIVLCAVVFGASFALGQDQGPNLSGVWRSDSQKSKLADGRPSADMRLKIDQSDSNIIMIMRVSSETGEEDQTFHFRIGSDDNSNKMHGAPMKSAVRWEKGTLVVDSVAKFGDGELCLNDRWALSADRQTLTSTERHQFGKEPAGEDTSVFVRQPNASWEPPQPPQAAEKAFKNIRVLQGLPAPQMMPTMMFFTQALGVKCDHCHLGAEFEKDDKPAKATARQMITMARKINEDNFPGQPLITCWTCHRGSIKPESAPTPN